MSATLQVTEEPLSDEDLQLLRRSRGGRSLTVVFAGLMFLLLVSSVVLLVVVIVYDRSLLRGGDGVVIVACTMGMAAFAVFLGRKLLRVPQAWRRFNRVLKGRVSKQIVSGHLTGFGLAEGRGISYVFGEQRVDVALPFWNEINRDTRDGFRPLTAMALTDLPVRLHLLTLQPDGPPALLRAEYPMSAEVWNSVEEISDADRDAVRKEELSLRKFFYMVALVPLVGSLFLGPLILLAAFLALMGLVLGMRSPRLKRARYKRGVRGVVEEAVTYRVRTTNSNVSTLVQNYRIGGVMHRVEHFGEVATPGQRVAFEYLDAKGIMGPSPLSFQIEDQPVMML
ncbi:hypothetical protein [Achromobacter anxifer]|uniref:hypothetical protein n=1 Tax=Achromobacter anxifer TaxID=1287737 RepID=UPI00155BD913|nr:hypothetical protein [Achromobacter anxifer]MDF8360822.1 hypothetical protein [Achromobacter anxifer]CAB5511529.1 hypothetical protein LMG26857_00817 [Achromobacter anxifer]